MAVPGGSDWLVFQKDNGLEGWKHPSSPGVSKKKYGEGDTDGSYPGPGGEDFLARPCLLLGGEACSGLEVAL